MTAIDEAWSVSRLARTIKGRVEDGAEPVWVRGELIGIKRYPSGHLYFGLRDETSKVDCTIWRNVATRLRTELVEGAEVFALGMAGVWEERTSLRFNITQVIPAAAVGAQAQSVEKIKQALLVDGLLDPARKRPLPPFVARIAVITSIAGAAVHDIITVFGPPPVAIGRDPGRQQCRAGRYRRGRAGPRTAHRVAARRHRLLHHRSRRWWQG